MPQFADRVKVTSTSTGTGAITLSSTAVSGYQAFPSSLDGETVGYVIESGSAWEIGTGTYTHSSLNLTRSLRSSSTGSLLSLASGTHTVFLTPAFQDIQIVEAFSSTSDLPSASASHGRIYHVHGEAAMYFAHSGSWVKLANYSDITTYTHPNHTGEVTSTGDGATVIADDVVDEANLKVSNTPTDGYVLTARSGNTGGMTWEAASGGIALTDLSVTQNTASGSGTLSYDNTSGVFSYTPPVISGGGGASYSDPIRQTEYTGTATTTFNASSSPALPAYTAGNIQVFLNGSKLAASDFTATNGTSVVLGSACAASDVVTIVEYGAPFASQYSSSIFTVGTSSEYNTSTKVLTTDYTANRVAVYLNGVKLLVGTDCTATNGTTIDLTNAAPVTGDKIEVVEHGALADTVTTLTGLSDTPSSLGTAGQILQVNSGGTALEFADNISAFTGLSDTPSSLGTAGQTLVVNSGGTALEFADAATGGGGGSLEATASGALANGDKVVINADGTVSVVNLSTVTQAAGSESVFEASSTNSTAIAYDANAQKVVVAYGKSGGVYAAVGTVSGETVSFGTSVQVSSSTYGPQIVYDTNAQKVVVVYHHYAKVGTVSGTSISFGSQVDFHSSASSISDTSLAYDANAQKIAIQYSNGSNSNYGTVVIGTISGTSISFGTPVVYVSRQSQYGGIAYDANSQNLVVGYQDKGTSNTYNGEVIVGTISGTSISFGSATTFTSNQVWYVRPVYDSAAQKTVIIYRDNSDSGKGKALVGTVSGTSISFGTAVTFETGVTQRISVTYNSNLEKIVIAYRDDSNTNKGTVIAGTVSGTSITFESAVLFNDGVTAAINTGIAYDTSSNRSVIVYVDADNSSYGTAVVFRNSAASSTNLTAENYIGISDGAYSDTATATIQIAGSVDDAQSGLTAGQAYYVQTDGTLSTTPDSPSVFAGTAVSSTKLIVKG